MSGDQQKDDLDQAVASINDFLDSIDAPKFLRVRRENVEPIEDGYRVRIGWPGYVKATVDVSHAAMTHLLMVKGIIGSLGKP